MESDTASDTAAASSYATSDAQDMTSQTSVEAVAASTTSGDIEQSSTADRHYVRDISPSSTDTSILYPIGESIMASWAAAASACPQGLILRLRHRRHLMRQ